MFRIESATNGTKYECDSTASNGDLECSYLQIEAQSALGTEQFFPNIVAVAQGLENKWTMMSGIMTASEIVAGYDSIRLYLYGTHESMNVFYKNISITPIPRTCGSQILNGNFEVGDSRFWKPSSVNLIGMSIFNAGAGGSEYSVMTWPLYGGANGHSISQDLDARCLEEGFEFLIGAKFQLLNATDMISGVECDPSLLTVSRPDHCPTVTIRGTECDGGDYERLYWNNIDFSFEWDPNGFNDFQRVFSVNAQLASCKVSFISNHTNLVMPIFLHILHAHYLF